MSVSRSTANGRGAVKTVDRLVSILDCFSPEQPAWSLAELSTHLELPKSTLHRFLVSLESHGILRRDSDDRRWRLGYRLSVWGGNAVQSAGLHQVARPAMQDLVDATGETAILTVFQAHEVVCIAKVETRHSVRMMLDVGMRRPPHAGASSKVLMAFLPEDKVQAIIEDKGLPRLCSNTITDPHELRAELIRIREMGYAVSREETDQGAWGIATPIRDPDGDVVAAIGIAGPSSRFTEEVVERYVALCRQAARRISTLLGCRIGLHGR
jgi:DNA-binding IclR family transcriptional regulator